MSEFARNDVEKSPAVASIETTPTSTIHASRGTHRPDARIIYHERLMSQHDAGMRDCAHHSGVSADKPRDSRIPYLDKSRKFSFCLMAVLTVLLSRGYDFAHRYSKGTDPGWAVTPNRDLLLGILLYQDAGLMYTIDSAHSTCVINLCVPSQSRQSSRLLDAIFSCAHFSGSIS